MKQALALALMGLGLSLACRPTRMPVPTPTLNPRLAQAREALQRGDALAALAQLESFVREHPEALDARVWLGDAYVMAGRMGEAEQVYREVLRQAPEHGPARLGLGIVLYRSGRLSEAVAEA